MSEVLDAISIATDCLSLCVKAITFLKNFFAAAAHAREELNALLILIEKAKNRLELVKLPLFELRKSNDSGIAATFTAACKYLGDTLKELVEEVSQVVDGQSRLSISKKLRWSMNKSTAEKIARQLREADEEMTASFVIVNSLTALRTRNDIEELKRLADDRSQITVAFATAPEGGDPASIPTARQERKICTWLGHVLVDRHPADYLELRHQLSEAAYWGDFDTVFSTINLGMELYGEMWANAPRLKERSRFNSITMWTPLHQAVFHHADVNVVQRLLDLGAFATLRTRTSDYGHQDMSALELAHDMEVFHLYDALSPVVRTHLPPQELLALESQFHRLIRSELGDRVDRERLYLPLVEPLTELRGDTMWFPVKFGYESAGYLYQLYGRELQVKSINIQGPHEEFEYRVTPSEIFETDQIFNFAGDVERDWA